MSSTIDKNELAQKIKALDGLTSDEKSALIGLLNTRKKYGLVWEEKQEDVEELLREKLPVFTEVKERRIDAQPQEKEEGKLNLFGNDEKDSAPPPDHIIIEGDNLHALTALQYTHAGKVDVIYIDPPYNTGAKDWKYNNDYVDKEDPYRHSKWISFIEKRLKIAKNLLTRDGIICVTIDDYEMPRLFMIMEEIFSTENHLGTLVIRNNPSGRSTLKGISITHEYALFFGKSVETTVGRLPRTEKQINRYDEQDETGAFEWVNFRKHGGTRAESPKMYYPIYLTMNSWRIPKMEWDAQRKEWKIFEEPKINESITFPIDEHGKERRWKWSYASVLENKNEFRVGNDRNGKLALYVKSRLKSEGVLPLTWWDKKEYSATAYGTNLLKEIFSDVQVFSYPKSIYALMDCLRALTSKKCPLILDFFAGSGTTLHATMALNAEDKGRRQCILVTNNENNICEEVTYERNKRVIQGYTKQNGEKVPGLTNNNLRYYKTDFVDREPTMKNRKALVIAATDLLCIKENCYEPVKKLSSKHVKVFENNALLLVVVTDSDGIMDSIDVIKQTTKKCKIYVFAPGAYPHTADYEEELTRKEFSRIELCALPDAIYHAYQAILSEVDRKGRKKKTAEVQDDNHPGGRE